MRWCTFICALFTLQQSFMSYNSTFGLSSIRFALPCFFIGYPSFPFFVQFHKSLFPDDQVPGFGAAHSSLWEALRERVALPMMDALEQILCLPRGEERQGVLVLLYMHAISPRSQALVEELK